MPSPSPPRQVALPDEDLNRLEAGLLQQRVHLQDCGHAIEEAAAKVRAARSLAGATP